MHCGAPSLGSAGRCIGHVDDAGFRRALRDAGRSRPLDFQGKTLDSALLGRVLALAPRDADGRPTLRCATFADATFVDAVSFAGVAFNDDVSFDRAVFKADACFDDAAFNGQARFGLSSFAGRTGFARARFGTHAWFSGATMAGETDFGHAQLNGPGWFGGASFGADVSFAGASFGADGNFDQATFGCHTDFASAVFRGEFSISGTAFRRPPRYEGARFAGPGGAPEAATRQVIWAGAPLAPWSSRAAAAIIDLAIPLGLMAAAVVLSELLRGLRYRGTLPGLVLAAAAAGAFLTVRNLIYQGHTGQTLGKRTIGLTLARKGDGQPVGVGASLLRSGLHVLDTLPLLLGWFVPLWSPSRQTFADRITSTVVVQQRGWAGNAPRREKVELAASGFG